MTILRRLIPAATPVAVLVVLGFASAPARADWVRVGENQAGDRYHVEIDQVTEIGDGVVVFDTLISFAEAEPSGAVVLIDRFVADCRTHTVTNVSWASYGPDQALVEADSLPLVETQAAPDGTLMAAEIDLACATVGH